MERKPGWWLDHVPALPLREATHRVEGKNIYYRIGGSGPPVLLLHPFTMTGQHWNPFIDAFGARYTLIVPDLPGHGRSDPFEGEFSHRDSARYLLDLLDALGYPRASGAGFSSGSLVLLLMALQQPERIEAAILISSVHRWLRAGRDRFRNRGWEALSPEMQAFHTRQHPGGQPQVSRILAQLSAMADSYADWDTAPEHLSLIKARTLIVAGDRDLADPVEQAFEAYRFIPNAYLWVVPGKGHGAGLWEDPAASAEAMLRFLMGDAA